MPGCQGITTSVDTAWGTVEVDKSSSDVLSKLGVAFMGAFEARNGRWGLIADLFYADLSQSRGTPLGLLFSRARFETEAKALSAYAAYRIHEDNRVSVDLMAGLRVNSLDIDLSLSPGLLPSQRLGTGETWVDPLIGGRLRFAHHRSLVRDRLRRCWRLRRWLGLDLAGLWEPRLPVRRALVRPGRLALCRDRQGDRRARCRDRVQRSLARFHRAVLTPGADSPHPCDSPDWRGHWPQRDGIASPYTNHLKENPMNTRLPVLLTLVVTTAVAGLATGAEPPASAAPATDFTLKRGQSLSSLCSTIRQSGLNVSIPDCARQILFANRQWFDDRFGYVWKDPASVKLDSAVRLWAGVPYVMPAELVSAQPAQAQPRRRRKPPRRRPRRVHPGHFHPKGKAPSKFTMEVLRAGRARTCRSPTRATSRSRRRASSPR